MSKKIVAALTDMDKFWDAVQNVIIYHQRTNEGNCACNAVLPVGSFHSDHVMKEIKMEVYPLWVITEIGSDDNVSTF